MRLLLGTLAVLLVLPGCSSGGAGEPAPAEPASPAGPSDTEPTEPSEPSGSGDAAAPTGDPLTFGSRVGSVTIRCFPEGPRRMVFLDSVTTDRPVALAGLETEGDALQVTGTWVRELGRREVTEGGLVDLRPGRSVPDRWPGTRPLEGFALEPDERYSFYVLAEVRPDATIGDMQLRWADDRTSDSSTYRFAGRTRSGGC